MGQERPPWGVVNQWPPLSTPPKGRAGGARPLGRTAFGSL